MSTTTSAPPGGTSSPGTADPFAAGTDDAAEAAARMPEGSWL